MKLSILCCALGLLQAVLSGPVAPGSSAEALHRRNIFYVGGEYVYNTTQGGTILINDQYVEELTPAGGVKHPYPIVFFHGGGVSGAVGSIMTYSKMIRLNVFVSNGSINPTASLAGPPTFSTRDTWYTSLISGASAGQARKTFPPNL